MQQCKLKRIGLSLRQVVDNADEQQPGVYTSTCVRTHGLRSCTVHVFTHRVRTTHFYCVGSGLNSTHSLY